MIRLLDYSLTEKERIIDQLDQLLHGLKGKIDVINSLETGRNFNERATAYDLVLIVEFNNKNDIDIYRTHPNHMEVLNYMKTLRLETAVVDCFIK